MDDLQWFIRKFENSIGLECTQRNVKQIKYNFVWIIMTPIPM